MTQSDEFGKRARQLFARVEKALILLITCACLAAAAVQTLYLFDPVRKALVPTERLEGQQVHP